MLLLAAALLGNAWADDEPVSCDISALRDPSGTVSVAWVSPLRRRASGASWLAVVRTSELRAWTRSQQASLPRMLQRLGLRRRDKEPSRSWKVVVFEVSSEHLCRPMMDREGFEPVVPGGVVSSCPPTLNRSSRAQDGCGHTIDRSDDSRGLQQFRVQWRDAAARGFCVLPAERFVAEASAGSVR